MDYTEADLKQALGDKFDPEAEYLLETHRGAFNRVSEGYLPVGELPDSTNDQRGTVVIMSRKAKS